MLVFNIRSLINSERRMSFANSIQLFDYNVIVLLETWLHENILDGELFSINFSSLGSGRKTTNYMSQHGDVLKAVKSRINSKKEFLDGNNKSIYLYCETFINTKKLLLICFFTPDEKNRYQNGYSKVATLQKCL